MIEAKKRKKTAPERGQQSFSLMMKRQIQIVFSMFHTKARNPNCSVSLSILCKASNKGSTLVSSTTVIMAEHILATRDCHNAVLLLQSRAPATAANN